MNTKFLHSKWGVEIEGIDFDLRNLERKLNSHLVAADNFFVSRLNDIYVLRSAKWDSCSDAYALLEVAAEHIRSIRSAIDLVDGCGSLELGTVFQFDEDHRVVNQTRFTKFEGMRVLPSQLPSSSELFWQVIYASQQNFKLNLAMSSIDHNPSWFDIYAAIECLEDVFGGEMKLVAEFPEIQVKKLKRSANIFRHAKGKFSPASDNMSLDDGRVLIKKLLNAAIIQKYLSIKDPPNLSTSNYHAPSFRYPSDVPIGLKKLHLASAAPQAEKD